MIDDILAVDMSMSVILIITSELDKKDLLF